MSNNIFAYTFFSSLTKCAPSNVSLETQFTAKVEIVHVIDLIINVIIIIIMLNKNLLATNCTEFIAKNITSARGEVIPLNLHLPIMRGAGHLYKFDH